MPNQPLLRITALSAEVIGDAARAKATSVLKKLSLAIGQGEVHAVMGPNGAGKSTLARALLGHPSIRITGGKVTFRGHDLLAFATPERASAGLFLAFQHPIGIPGVTVSAALRASVNAQRAARNELPLSVPEFRSEANVHLKMLRLDPGFLDRELNVGLSGGEQKKAEVLQLLMLQPVLAVLDETDSGLDLDARRVVAKAVTAYRCGRNAVLVITHEPRLLALLKPDYVHILIGGRIVKSGGPALATQIEKRGYDWLTRTR